ncbi:agamous-like MADS-box protein AGL80 [Senna tora]|uniref:Agamous-like MADS-box protein AGL80 n=1 Tax=Senna tora TaxID=362788 RepID=A0A834WI90_9FABA|nr:agamous-like MADS-box protein AGL80 [Senna tora]
MLFTEEPGLSRHEIEFSAIIFDRALTVPLLKAGGLPAFQLQISELLRPLSESINSNMSSFFRASRPRVRFEYISNEGARRSSFKKRKEGVMKKMSELTTLCGIEACAVIFSPFNPGPEVWPNVMGVHHVVSQYRKMAGIQKRSVLDQQSFIKQTIAKTMHQLERLRKETRERQTEYLMHQCMAGMNLRSLSISDMYCTRRLLEKKIADIDKKIREKEEVPPTPTAASLDDNGLHLAFGDISQEENAFWFKLFP